MNTIGKSFTVIAWVASETHPEDVFVKTNEVLPSLTPVTTPLSSTIAMFSSKLAHVPPLVGDN